MPFHPTLFPPIPEDTAEIAGSLFGQEHIYVRLGNHFNHILLDVSKTFVEFPANRYGGSYYLYALITGVQYAEDLTDRQLVEAVSTRVDLKYALHLPLNYPSFEPGELCAFRRQLFRDQTGQQMFQVLLHHLQGIAMLEENEGQPLRVMAVLEAVCTINRMEIVLEAIFRALEVLAINNCEWLRQITLPYWYDRYSRRAWFASYPTPNIRWKATIHRIGEDIQYLLDEIKRAEISSPSSLQEIQNLRKVWEDQYEQILDAKTDQKPIQFRAAGCVSCATNAEEIEV